MGIVVDDILDMNKVVMAVLVMTAGLLCSGMLSTNLGGLGPSLAFSWHAVFMSLGFPLCMGLGIHSYSVEPRRNVARVYHGFLNGMGLVSVALGYGFVYKAHMDSHSSQIGDGATPARKAHVWIGYVVMGFLLLQGCSGVTKMACLARNNRACCSWHGRLGRPAFVMGMFNIFIAVWFWGAWSILLKLVLSLLLAASVGAVLWPMSSGASDHRQFEDEVGEEDSAELSKGSCNDDPGNLTEAQHLKGKYPTAAPETLGIPTSTPEERACDYLDAGPGDDDSP